MTTASISETVEGRRSLWGRDRRLIWDGGAKAVDVDVMNELECRRRFLERRVAFRAEALTPYAGRWIAWSPDGGRIVADADAPEELDDRIRAAGEDPERCVVEGIPGTDAMLGGAGLGPTGS